jgi:hypothetical protein
MLSRIEIVVVVVLGSPTWHRREKSARSSIARTTPLAEAATAVCVRLGVAAAAPRPLEPGRLSNAPRVSPLPSCVHKSWLLSRDGCQNRWQSLINCDHGDSITSLCDSPAAVAAAHRCCCCSLPPPPPPPPRARPHRPR